MLDGLFLTPAVSAIEEALADRAAGKVAVIGNAKLAAVLAERLGAQRVADEVRPSEVIPVAITARAAKMLTRRRGPTLAAPVGELAGLAAGDIAAIVGVDVTLDDNWPTTLRAWSRIVRDGGALVFVDRGRAAEASRRALCAGLCELEQRRVGRAVVTSGLVTHLA